MLTIAPRTLRTLETASRQGLHQRLARDLAADFPGVLAGYPVNIGFSIVSNMLDRASAYDLSYQSAIRAFCGYMLAVAPNFDDQPEIAACLRSDPRRIDAVMLDLPDSTPSSSWEAAARDESRLPLFCTNSVVRGSDLRACTISALQLVLGDRVATTDTMRLADQAQRRALSLGLNMVPDAPLVLAGCTLFFGADFDQSLSPVVSNPQARALEMVRQWRTTLFVETGRFL